MGGVPLHYIDLRTFCYATEDKERVEQALRLFLPEEYPIDRETSKGHHGDRIIVLSTRVENADNMRYILDKVTELHEFERLDRELDRRVDDDCSLFLQFDKQAAYRGEVRLGRGILFRAKVEAYPARKEAAVENARLALKL